MAELAQEATQETPPPAPELTPGQKIAAAVLTPPAETAAPETTATETTEQAPPTLAERLKAELGFENVADDTQAVERLISAYKQQKNEFGSQLQQAIEELKALKAPEVAVVETRGQQTSGWEWNPPQVDLNAAAQYRTADGWKPETPADLRQSFEARERYVNQFATKFVNDPKAAMQPAMVEVFNELFEQRFGQVQSQQKQQHEFEQLTAQNAWIWESDPVNGKATGKLSAQGQRVDELMVGLQQRFGDRITPAEALAEALEKFELESLRSKTTRSTATQTAQELAAQKKAEVLNRAAPGLPTRTGSLPIAGQRGSQNRNLSPGQKLVQNAQRNGVALTP